MASARANRLDRHVDSERDHILGPDGADITLVEYGSYVCAYCHAAHDVVRRVRDHFGDQVRYVYRHLPLTDRSEATQAAQLAEYTAATTGDFWSVHDVLMRGDPAIDEADLSAVAAKFSVPPPEQWDPAQATAAASRVREDARSGLRSGARLTPTFFINGRRYEGAWDEGALREAMLRSLGHRIHAASVDFVRWAPSTGVLLLLMTVLAVVISNTEMGPSFLRFWEMTAGVNFGSGSFVLPLVDWVNHGLLSVFFLVVGLEIKRELTIGRLATVRAAAFPVAAAIGGMVVPAVIFVLLSPAPSTHAWGATIATDTAFAIALLVLLGDRVPVDLRVFLTAAVILDDLVAIAVIALFYSGAISLVWLLASAGATAALMVLNRWHVYRAVPYAILGVVLWVALHEAGLHATLAGVILAAVTPTRPPPNLRLLMAQAQVVIDTETEVRGEAIMRMGPSEPALRALDVIHDRIESPASKLLRVAEPWSSYVVLPVFALANAGVAWSSDVFEGHGQLMLAIVVALVVGKLVGILAAARLAVRLGFAFKPPAYSWRQVAGAGALAGIGFTMSLFIAGEALDGADYAAAKIAIFIASIVAGALGSMILWRPSKDPENTGGSGSDDRGLEVGSPIDLQRMEVA